jgi:uncharacterized membrane protein
MQVHLEHPEFLWLLAGAVPLLLWAALKSYAIAARWKRVLSFLLRVLGVLLVTLALARPVLRLASPDQCVVFALDVSDSVEAGAIDRALAQIGAATKELAAHQRAALLAFGGRALVLRDLASEPITPAKEQVELLQHRRAKETLRQELLAIERDLTRTGPAALEERRALLAAIEKQESEMQAQETDVREALRLARSLMPDSARRRIVLFSDGNWTRGDPEAELQLLARAGITVDVIPFERARPGEVVAERLLAPSQVRIREPVELELQVGAAEEREVRLKLFRDQFLLKSEKVLLKKGRNSVRIPKQELDEGFHEFQAVLETAGDPTPENNSARAVVVVDGRPKVLLLEGREEDARWLEQALRDEDIAVEVRPPIGFPEDMNELLGFDVLMLSDVPATDLLTSQLALVKSYVRDFGGGLIMAGGEKSFGLGGYYRTPVEDALPVRMPIKKTIEKPNLALVIVLDRSGSMSGEKLALAKEAAIAAVEVLKAKDQIGVVAFDSAAEWAVELQPASNREEVATLVARIAVGGGTLIYSGLYEAYEALHDCSAKLKHCIVLTDGHTEGSREEHLDLVHRMASEEITVSTVGIGEADQALLQALAEAGNGEAYFTNDFGSIPQIFTKETLRASKSMLVEDPFVPVVIEGDDQILKGVEIADAPLLLGYVATSPKETARVLMVSDHGDPVLARWNYGLGRAAAFTSDIKNRWAVDWVGWPQFGKFWGQVVRSVMSTGTTSPLQQTADVQLQRGEVKIALDTRDREGRFLDEVVPSVHVVDAVGNARALPMTHHAPGLVETRFPLPAYGEFVRLRVESRLQDQVVALKKYAVVESYPPEYRAAAADLAFLETAHAATGGRRLGEAAGCFDFAGDPASGLRDLWRLLVLLAVLLLPLDIALRRLA